MNSTVSLISQNCIKNNTIRYHQCKGILEKHANIPFYGYFAASIST